MEKEKENYYDKLQHKLKNNRVVGFILVLFAILIALSQATEAIEKISKLFSNPDKVAATDTLTKRNNVTQPLPKVSNSANKKTEKQSKIDTTNNSSKTEKQEEKIQKSIIPTVLKKTEEPIPFKEEIKKAKISIVTKEKARIYVDNNFIGAYLAEPELSYGSHEIKVIIGKDTCIDIIRIPNQKIITFNSCN